MTRTALHARITGRVQGVSFRAWTQERARALGLSGWVRNRPDGSVEALISGPAAAVEDMRTRLHDGPPAARVAEVETAPAAEGEPPHPFEVRA
ncbi:acylphosphatase [Roseovarius sp. SYSU LYC5161]|jgi:acylphosphatase|uniref:acylphosphatase n=1 Tax=Roseovarius halophilus (ex Wu et al. 2025) TaxID=3376060 RepID=UPI00399C27A3